MHASLSPQVQDLSDRMLDAYEVALASPHVLQALVGLYDELEPLRNSQQKVSLSQAFPACTCQMHIEFYGSCQVEQHKLAVPYIIHDS